MCCYGNSVCPTISRLQTCSNPHQEQFSLDLFKFAALECHLFGGYDISGLRLGTWLGSVLLRVSGTILFTMAVVQG